MSDTVKVIRILDGGTFAAKKDGVEKTFFFALQDFRPPEKGQNRFQLAKGALEKLILEKYVSVEHKSTGHYGLPFVEAKVDGIDVNSAMQKYAV